MEQFAFMTRLDNGTMPTPEPLFSSGFFGRAYAMSNDGMIMTIFTLILTAALELTAFDQIKGILKRKGGSTLYLQGVTANLINNGIFGPPLYELVSNRWMSGPCSTLHRAALVLGILIGHSIFYYSAHRLMHTRPMYWAHKFHHKFNVYVTPSTANAVSPTEYAIAYMLPFIIGAKVLQPDRMSMFIGVGCVSVPNLLIHTPILADTSSKYLPWLFCSTADHLDHHRRLTTHYGAPTFSTDRLLAAVVGKPASWNSEFDAAEQVAQKKAL
jgi:sterol desaturase/sphingolipid hydroxylase (fatty acid hydroxylase superfamily)